MCGQWLRLFGILLHAELERFQIIVAAPDQFAAALRARRVRLRDVQTQAEIRAAFRANEPALHAARNRVEIRFQQQRHIQRRVSPALGAI